MPSVTDTADMPRMYTVIKGRAPRQLAFQHSDDPRTPFATFAGAKQALSELWELTDDEALRFYTLQVAGADFASSLGTLTQASNEKRWYNVHRKLRSLLSDCTITLVLRGEPKVGPSKRAEAVKETVSGLVDDHASDTGKRGDNFDKKSLSARIPRQDIDSIHKIITSMQAELATLHVERHIIASRLEQLVASSERRISELAALSSWQAEQLAASKPVC